MSSGELSARTQGRSLQNALAARTGHAGQARRAPGKCLLRQPGERERFYLRAGTQRRRGGDAASGQDRGESRIKAVLFVPPPQT